MNVEAIWPPRGLVLVDWCSKLKYSLDLEITVLQELLITS